MPLNVPIKKKKNLSKSTTNYSHIFFKKLFCFFNRIFQLYLNLNSILVYGSKYIVLSKFYQLFT